MAKTSTILTTQPTPDYALLDSGEGEKLERFGKFVLSQLDPQALWAKNLPAAEWKKADGRFNHEGGKRMKQGEGRGNEKEAGGGGWSLKSNMPTKWEISFGGLQFWIKPTAFKHTGLFPEQMPNWEWCK